MSRPDVQTVIVIGSQARAQPPADEYSDLDLVLLCADRGAYAADGDWIETIARHWLAVRGTTGWGDPEWDVVFEGGAKVDFVFVNAALGPPTAGLAEVLRESVYGFVYARGARVLFDRDRPENEGQRLVFEGQPLPVPTAEEFSQAVQRFWLHGLRAARFLRRGEVWRAARLVNGGMKDAALRMVEWQAQSAQGAGQPAPDTWYEGHFLERWADPRAAAEMTATFAAGEPPALWEALFASLAAFRRVAAETAGRWGFVYPEAHEGHIAQLIRTLREGA